jgi:hypothetical protein
VSKHPLVEAVNHAWSIELSATVRTCNKLMTSGGPDGEHVRSAKDALAFCSARAIGHGSWKRQEGADQLQNDVTRPAVLGELSAKTATSCIKL